MAEDGKREIWVGLEETKWRGVRWYVTSVSMTGGRKANARPIINSDEQIVDDIGLKQRKYSVRGYVTTTYRGRTAKEEQEQAQVEQGEALEGNIHKIDKEYREARKELIDAFELKGKDSFWHPIDGEINGLVVKEYTIDEAMTEVGLGRVTVEFIRETTEPIPKTVEGSKEVVKLNSAIAGDFALEVLKSEYSLVGNLVGAYESAVSKMEAVYGAVESVMEVVDAVVGALDAVQQRIASGLAVVTDTVNDVVKIADEIKQTVASLNSILAVVGGAIGAIKNAFNFGGLDIKFDILTSSGRQKQKNADALNTTMNTLFLTSAYDIAVDIDFVTLADIEEVEALLEGQHFLIVDSGAAQIEVIQALETLRLSFFDFIASAKLNALKVVEEDVNLTTPRVLSYLLYESDENAEVIGNLNDVQSYELLSGPAVKVLSS